MWAAGGSLPDMGLAFALMAAVNGSAGSRAALSCGLFGTGPHRRQPAAAERFSTAGGGGAGLQSHCPIMTQWLPSPLVRFVFLIRTR